MSALVATALATARTFAAAPPNASVSLNDVKFLAQQFIDLYNRKLLVADEPIGHPHRRLQALQEAIKCKEMYTSTASLVALTLTLEVLLGGKDDDMLIENMAHDGFAVAFAFIKRFRQHNQA